MAQWAGDRQRTDREVKKKATRNEERSKSNIVELKIGGGGGWMDG